ncbi:hypothetical protein ABW19_dt0200989 [Dactylella cylindrospora]|nr:hypothetical protein ABW19_dt0200989 [Dactylella cylindrospora]
MTDFYWRLDADWRKKQPHDYEVQEHWEIICPDNNERLGIWEGPGHSNESRLIRGEDEYRDRLLQLLLRPEDMSPLWGEYIPPYARSERNDEVPLLSFPSEILMVIFDFVEEDPLDLISTSLTCQMLYQFNLKRLKSLVDCKYVGQWAGAQLVHISSLATAEDISKNIPSLDETLIAEFDDLKVTDTIRQDMISPRGRPTPHTPFEHSTSYKPQNLNAQYKKVGNWTYRVEYLLDLHYLPHYIAAYLKRYQLWNSVMQKDICKITERYIIRNLLLKEYMFLSADRYETARVNFGLIYRRPGAYSQRSIKPMDRFISMITWGQPRGSKGWKDWMAGPWVGGRFDIVSFSTLQDSHEWKNMTGRAWSRTRKAVNPELA